MLNPGPSRPFESKRKMAATRDPRAPQLVYEHDKVRSACAAARKT